MLHFNPNEIAKLFIEGGHPYLAFFLMIAAMIMLVLIAGATKGIAPMIGKALRSRKSPSYRSTTNATKVEDKTCF